jgi:hypothetical protein
MVDVGRVHVAERVAGGSGLDVLGPQPCTAMSSMMVAAEIGLFMIDSP